MAKKKSYEPIFLAHIGNKKSADFIYKTLIEPAEKSNWGWKDRVLKFYGAAARACSGDGLSEEVSEDLDEGLRYYLARLREEAGCVGRLRESATRRWRRRRRPHWHLRRHDRAGNHLWRWL